MGTITNFFKRNYVKFDYGVKKVRASQTYKGKIGSIIKRSSLSSNLSNKEKQEIKNYFNKFNISVSNFDWHAFLKNFEGGFDVRYMPETTFYTLVEPSLNKRIMFPAIEDKNLTDVLLENDDQPKSIVKNINGFYFDSQNKNSLTLDEAVKKVSNYDSVVIKPSFGSFAGKGVELIKKDNSIIFSEKLKEIFEQYNSDFLIQEPIIQHEQLSLLNSSSINTIRIVSYLRDSGVEILSSIIRIGRKGKFVDNSRAGGIACGVNDKGELCEYAYDELGNKYYETDEGTFFKGFKIPMYEKVKKCVQKHHKKLPYFKIISWDIAVNSENEAILIEFNSFGQGINILQMANGPLLGNYTDEILSQCCENKLVEALIVDANY